MTNYFRTEQAIYITLRHFSLGMAMRQNIILVRDINVIASNDNPLIEDNNIAILSFVIKGVIDNRLFL